MKSYNFQSASSEACHQKEDKWCTMANHKQSNEFFTCAISWYKF